MRTSAFLRLLTPLATAGLLCSCGGTTPTAPGGGSTTLQIPTGPQVLRIVYQGPLCAAIERGGGSLPIVYTPVTVSRGGSEWIVTATGAAGDVELRIHTLGGGSASRVAGTIKGTAIHIPEVAGGPAVWHAQVSFGSDGRTTLDGVIFPLMPSATTGAFDGIGAGSITLSDAAGGSCGGTSFSWVLSPQM